MATTHVHRAARSPLPILNSDYLTTNLNVWLVVPTEFVTLKVTVNVPVVLVLPVSVTYPLPMN